MGSTERTLLLSSPPSPPLSKMAVSLMRASPALTGFTPGTPTSFSRGATCCCPMPSSAPPAAEEALLDLLPRLG